ncbi:hypothetical protein DFH06DRAFT_580166 [Mycena polygramma]|nr:hypothetical protein DFH06DRAFT_580166 [Mycena polygramma]
MGTRGYKVYRHKGYYYVHYNHSDSYPSVYGIQVAAEIPRDAESYRMWLEDLRGALDRRFEDEKEQLDCPNGSELLTKERPANDLVIEWIYEFDLDHEVFLVDSNPLFPLNNMPPTPELFLAWIGVDSYGHRSYSPSTPQQHIYNWRATPPEVENNVIDDYVSCQPSSPCSVSIDELLQEAKWAAVKLCELHCTSLSSAR